MSIENRNPKKEQPGAGSERRGRLSLPELSVGLYSNFRKIIPKWGLRDGGTLQIVNSSEQREGEPAEGSESQGAEVSKERNHETGGAGNFPPIDLPPRTGGAEFPEEPFDKLSTGERAYRLFESHTPTLPTATEVEHLRRKESAINWLGYVSTRSPLAVAFGAENSEARHERAVSDFLHQPIIGGELPKRLKPEKADEIVDRQLSKYSDTLTRVHEGASAAADIADITSKHKGRILIDRRLMGDRNRYPMTTYLERFAISFKPDQSFTVAELSSATDRSDELLRHDTSNGEVHLVARDAKRRYRAKVEDGQFMVEKEDVFDVKPGDTEYFSRLSQDLTTYKDLLLQVAEHAGSSREAMIDPKTGQIDRDYILERVDPVIANPDFQVNLPLNLRGELMKKTYSLAGKANSTFTSPESIVQFGFRLGGYFRAALGRQDS